MQTNDATEAVLQSIAKAERHIRSEYGTRMVGVMETVGAHPHFVMMIEPGVVRVVSGRGDVDLMYKASVELAEPKVSRLLSQLATDWYVFVENVPTRLWIADGRLHTVQTVTMFVTDDARGITGEYAWQRTYPVALPASAQAALPHPERALMLLERHDTLLDAVLHADPAKLEALLEPGCLWTQRDYLDDVEGGKLLELRGSAQLARYLERWRAVLRPAHVSILNRRVTDWYVFSEELWILRPAHDEECQCRIAMIYPVSETGLFEGALGFGRAPSPLVPSARTKMGISFWPVEDALTGMDA